MIRLDDKTRRRIQKVVNQHYPTCSIGQCIEINKSVAKFLRDELKDELNDTGRVNVIQGKVMLDREITDHRGGDRRKPFATFSPDHVYLLVCPNGSDGVWDAHQAWYEGTSSSCMVWDFATGVFGDARIDEYLPMDDELNVGEDFDPRLSAALAKEFIKPHAIRRRPAAQSIHVRSHRRSR